MQYLKNVVTLRLFPGLCTGCGRCTEVCPHGVLVKAGKVVEVRNRDLCIECGACMMNCAYGAITVKTGVGCAAAVINGMLRNSEPSCECSSDDCCC